MSYTCFTDFVHHRKLQRSGGTHFLGFTQSVININGKNQNQRHVCPTLIKFWWSNKGNLATLPFCSTFAQTKRNDKQIEKVYFQDNVACFAYYPLLNACRGFPRELTPWVKPCCIIRIFWECSNVHQCNACEPAGAPIMSSSIKIYTGTIVNYSSFPSVSGPVNEDE